MVEGDRTGPDPQPTVHRADRVPLAAELGTTVLDDVVWPTDGVIDEPTLAALGGDTRFVLSEHETCAFLRARIEQVAARTEEVLRSADLDTTHPLPVAPWFEPGVSWSVRRVAIHMLAEISQHAGHADILREAIDSRTMYELIAEDQGIDMSYIGAWFAAHPEVPAPQW